MENGHKPARPKQGRYRGNHGNTGDPSSREKEGVGQDQESSSPGPEVSSPTLLVCSCAKGVEIQVNVVSLCSQSQAFHWVPWLPRREWDPVVSLPELMSGLRTSACPDTVSHIWKRCKYLRGQPLKARMFLSMTMGLTGPQILKDSEGVKSLLNIGTSKNGLAGGSCISCH